MTREWRRCALELADGDAELEVKARLESRETVRRFLVKSAKT